MAFWSIKSDSYSIQTLHVEQDDPTLTWYRYLRGQAYHHYHSLFGCQLEGYKFLVCSSLKDINFEFKAISGL